LIGAQLVVFLAHHHMIPLELASYMAFSGDERDNGRGQSRRFYASNISGRDMF